MESLSRSHNTTTPSRGELLRVCVWCACSVYTSVWCAVSLSPMANPQLVCRIVGVCTSLLLGVISGYSLFECFTGKFQFFEFILSLYIGSVCLSSSPSQPSAVSFPV